jgi:hypothetical protein
MDKSYIHHRHALLRYRTKHSGQELTITLPHMTELLNSPCYYCGQFREKMCIERQDNKIGYTDENTVSACGRCNNLKGIKTLEEFAELIEKKSLFDPDYFFN